jgi:transglutaminase-like putative cysteine protease
MAFCLPPPQSASPGTLVHIVEFPLAFCQARKSMTILSVRHKTVYTYNHPVVLGEHRLMCRPRDSHDLRLLETALVIDPPSSSIRWIHDTFGNSIAIVSFGASATQLMFESSFKAEHFPAPSKAIELENYATHFPFSYSADDALDLGRTKERHYPDPEHKIDAWAQAQVAKVAGAESLKVLTNMVHAIREQFVYAAREAEGTQSPLETLEQGSGSCRDFALFMMEAVRSLGLAARFVSGYLYDEKLIGAAGGLVGSGSTHAWLEVFLPGAGWIEFDPTNALIGGRNLIRVAVTRDPKQAIPLQGAFTGESGAFNSMTIDVQVTTE